MHFLQVATRDFAKSILLANKIKRLAGSRHASRLFCDKVDAKKKYSASVALPKSKFPVFIKSSQVSQRDEKIAKKCGFDELYNWQRENQKGSEFILHDGPPYANGSVHLGHAVNKVLKDIANRERLLAGCKVHYIPGWDCHGLPIELKAIGENEKNHLDSISLRQKARAYSEKAIKDQEAEFKSWGVMADWENKYKTSSPEMVKNELRCFQNLYERSLVFRDLKPVYWSPVSHTGGIRACL
ncbi:isoleucine--tRNA ligase, mitochondrial-like [Neocloeon triangulifer]|uniref:isoleucine--tRNA ligase, mitochondrial-like n=1 Tax=Neocloeon triangulifer TaxID=2078957 RepID=UPI00286ED1DD|nr:isoleucine--tRNA ligase, mitochondrial-like [Neocloeon triangulifer]